MSLLLQGNSAIQIMARQTAWLADWLTEHNKAKIQLRFEEEIVGGM
jgi:hypothetical protein